MSRNKVSDPFVGEGGVEQVIRRAGIELWWYMVKWDTPPPLDYNLWKNPTPWIPREVQ